jgi:hypothetical protein
MSGSVVFVSVESGNETGNVTGGKVIGVCSKTNRRRTTEKTATIAAAVFLALDDMIEYDFREGQGSTQKCPLQKLRLDESVASFPHSPNPNQELLFTSPCSCNNIVCFNLKVLISHNTIDQPKEKAADYITVTG